MNTQVKPLELKDCLISGGKEGAGEVPLWLGNSTLRKNGQPVRMSVTKDKEWFWLRFDTPLSEAVEVELSLKARGFNYSKKRRLWWWATSTPEVAKFIRGLGATQVQHFIYVAPVIGTVEPHKDGGIELPVAVEDMPKGKVSTTVGTVVHVNAAGRYVDDNGRFVATKNLVSSHVPKGTEGSNGKPVVPASKQEEHTVAYTTGYEDGLDYCADESNTVTPRSRITLAKVAGTTVEELSRRMGDDYLQGFFAGVEEARPMPAVKGFMARFASRQ